MNFFWEIASSFWYMADQRDQLLIVTLHRIDHPHGLPVSTVKKSLKFLADRYTFVLPEQLLNTKIRGKMALLTVDDGHREVYSALYPIVQSLNISMVLCLTTDFFLRNRWLWVDKINWILEQPNASQHIQSFELEEGVTFSGRRTELTKYCKSLSPNVRDKLIESIANHCELAIPSAPVIEYYPVSPTEVEEMLKSGLVELASHTVTHPILKGLSDAHLDFELQHSKQELEDFTGRRINSFCYPNGLPGDYDTKTIKAVHRAGYSMAFSSSEGINYKGNIKWDELKRIHVHRTSYTFQRSTSGLTEALARLRNCWDHR